MVLSKTKYNRVKKPLCPFGRRCFSDSSICGYIGYYAECPVTLEDRILVEAKEGVYRGETPYDLLRRVRRHG